MDPNQGSPERNRGAWGYDETTRQMKLRVVIDSNIYVSAVVFGGVPRSLLVWAELGRFEICTSPVIRQEVERTLSQKFEWPPEQIDQACSPLWTIAHQVVPELSLAVTDDPDDNRIVECAVAGKAKMIVTGNDDLLRLNHNRPV